VPDPSERLVNLALYLASSRSYVSAEMCRGADLGYPEGQDDGAFLRMFERDKDALRAAGLVIDVRKVDEVEAYRLDADATFAHEVALEPDEVAAVRAVAAALTDDPGFPFGEDLALALGKLGAAGETGPLAAGELVEGARGAQARGARTLAEAVQARKTATFGYTNRYGEDKRHTVDPYGIFFREGRWYLIALDEDRGEARTYAIARMRDVSVNGLRPHTPDFEPPADFDVRDYERLPFQYGSAAFTAEVRFGPDEAWRAPRLTRGQGTLTTAADGSAHWTVEARSVERLAQSIVEAGPGVVPVAPRQLVDAVSAGLTRVLDAHG
jgi:proteasome accessory factor B